MTYARNWAEIAERANEFIEFLQGDDFFSQPYETNRDYLVIRNPEMAIHYATDSSWEEFTDWETVIDSQFTENFEWELNLRIDYYLDKNNYFSFFDKNLNGVLEKWTTLDGIGLAHELIMHDISYILNCYANDSFPPIWQEIKQIYYEGGLPCGWSGLYPEGKMVVFSNC